MTWTKEDFDRARFMYKFGVFGSLPIIILGILDIYFEMGYFTLIAGVGLLVPGLIIFYLYKTESTLFK